MELNIQTAELALKEASESVLPQERLVPDWGKQRDRGWKCCKPPYPAECKMRELGLLWQYGVVVVSE